MRRLRIAIASSGRFHVLDLARELHRLGHEVKFYSYVPLARARGFGLPDECHVSLLPPALPFLLWQRLAPHFARETREAALYKALNWTVIFKLQPCDIFHCMSGIYVEAAHYARRKFGAQVWIVRGSRHILSQDEILADVPGAERPSRQTIRRELAGYSLADRIDIPSQQVEESFRREPGTVKKLFRNAYGVDLSMFPLNSTTPPLPPTTFLVVGNWSLQKGCDILVKAVRYLPDVRIQHVGSIVDLPFPNGDPQFIHHKPVNQAELVEFYRKAHALVLPSRQDGMAMVLSQALACGLPVICTAETGGADLMHTPALASRITMVPSNSVRALAEAMASFHERVLTNEQLPQLTSFDRETLTWSAYTRRYTEQLEKDSLDK